jgi:hypothetical protein
MTTFNFSGSGRFINNEFIPYVTEPEIVMVTMTNNNNTNIMLLYNKLNIYIYPDNYIFIHHTFSNKELNYSDTWYKIFPIDVLNIINNYTIHLVINDFKYPSGQTGTCQFTFEFTNKGIKKIKKILTNAQL